MKQISTKLIIALISFFAFHTAYADSEYEPYSAEWASAHGIQYNEFTTVEAYDAYAAASGQPSSRELHDMAAAIGFFNPGNFGGIGDDSMYGGSGVNSSSSSTTLTNPDGTPVKVHRATTVKVRHKTVGTPLPGQSVTVKIGRVRLSSLVNNEGYSNDKNGGRVRYTLGGATVNSNGTTTYTTITYTNINSTSSGIDWVYVDNISTTTLHGDESNINPPTGFINSGGSEFMVAGPIESLPYDPYNFFRLNYFYVPDNTNSNGYRLTEIEIDETIYDSEEANENYSRVAELMDMLGISDLTNRDNGHRRAHLLGDPDFSKDLYDDAKAAEPLSTSEKNNLVNRIDEVITKKRNEERAVMVLDILGIDNDQEANDFLVANPDFAGDLFNDLMIAVPLSDTQSEEFLEILNLLKELDGWEKELKKAIAESITSTAELMHKVYGKLNTLANRYPSSIVYINKIVDKLRDTATDYINTNPNTCTWGDLFNMWLFEKGDNPLVINSNSAVTTSTLKIQEGVSQARLTAISKIENNELQDNKVFNDWVFGQAEAYDSVSNQIIETAFLGSYRTNVEIIKDSPTDYRLKFKVSNTSGWESATRFRIDNDNNGQHDGIFPDKQRGEGINLGGNFSQVWTWTENFKL